MKKKKLGKIDWIYAAFRALCEGGANAIRVEALAREIGSTKGSFYWHFKDLADLQEAMLDYWQSHGTTQVIDIADEMSDPKDAILEIVRRAISGPPESAGGLVTEVAIRDWGRWSEIAKARILHVDKSRIDYLNELFQKVGYDAATAKQKAQILYSVYVGATHLRATGNDVKDALLIGFAQIFI